MGLRVCDLTRMSGWLPRGWAAGAESGRMGGGSLRKRSQETSQEAWGPGIGSVQAESPAEADGGRAHWALRAEVSL